MLKFTLFGFPVTVHWMFWIVTAMLGGGFGASTPQEFQEVLMWVAAAFVSILWHELGHAFLMRRFGSRASIMLYGFGGLASANGYYTRVQSILVSLAGPCFGLMLWVVFLGLASVSKNDPWLVQVFMKEMLWINKVWSLVNLLPVLPLDGGRVMDAVLGGGRKAIIISVVTAALVAAYFFVRHGFSYNGILFAMLAMQNFRRLQSNPAPWWPGMG